MTGVDEVPHHAIPWGLGGGGAVMARPQANWGDEAVARWPRQQATEQLPFKFPPASLSEQPPHKAPPSSLLIPQASVQIADLGAKATTSESSSNL
jgi:hypothetical protein